MPMRGAKVLDSLKLEDDDGDTLVDCDDDDCAGRDDCP